MNRVPKEIAAANTALDRAGCRRRLVNLVAEVLFVAGRGLALPFGRAFAAAGPGSCTTRGALPEGE